VTSHSYKIRVIGTLGPATREAFADMMVEAEQTVTVLSGDLDQRALHNVLDRVRALGLELIEIKQAAPPD
jgi:xanthine/CO dehydrogenase XdhC/CoxF family maturation factor